MDYRLKALKLIIAASVVPSVVKYDMGAFQQKRLPVLDLIWMDFIVIREFIQLLPAQDKI